MHKMYDAWIQRSYVGLLTSSSEYKVSSDHVVQFSGKCDLPKIIPILGGFENLESGFGVWTKLPGTGGMISIALKTLDKVDPKALSVCLRLNFGWNKLQKLSSGAI